MCLHLSAQVTTYQILTSDFNKEKKSGAAVNRFPPIGKIKWHRSAAPLTCCCMFVSLEPCLHAICMAQSALGMSTQVSMCTVRVKLLWLACFKTRLWNSSQMDVQAALQPQCMSIGAL